MVTKLIVASGKSAGRSISLKRNKLLIGRAEECDVRPLSEEVSRRHCVITVGPADVWVEDLKSRNGTFVNGSKIEPATRKKLADGDMIRVGSLELRVSQQSPVATGSESQVSKWLTTDGSSVISQSDLTLSDLGPSADTTVPLQAAAPSTPPRDESPAAASEETVTSRSTTMIALDDLKAAHEAKDKPGSLPKSAAKKPESSRDAAAEALKKFFERK